MATTTTTTAVLGSLLKTTSTSGTTARLLPTRRIIKGQSLSLSSSSSPYWTRLRHRWEDLYNVAAFSLCPFDSWSTQLHLQSSDKDGAASATGVASATGGSPRSNDNDTTTTTTTTLNITQWTGFGSGGFVWGSARRLAAQLQTYNHHFAHVGSGGADAATTKSEDVETNQTFPASTAALPPLSLLSSYWPGLNVIELGAGTGALGLALATMGANVTLTDQAAFVFPGTVVRASSSSSSTSTFQVDDATTIPLKSKSLLDLLRLNVANNVEQCWQPERWPHQQAVQVREMLWGNDAKTLAALPHAKYDVIVASDVLLFRSAQVDFLATLRHLSTPQTVIWIEHTDRDDDGYRKENVAASYPADLRTFFQLLADDTQVEWLPRVIKDHGRHLTILLEQAKEGKTQDQ